jgi:hypothetical protein
MRSIVSIYQNILILYAVLVNVSKCRSLNILAVIVVVVVVVVRKCNTVVMIGIGLPFCQQYQYDAQSAYAFICILQSRGATMAQRLDQSETWKPEGLLLYTLTIPVL